MSKDRENLSRETLDAYADGELSPAEMTRVAALIANRADLQAYVEKQAQLKRQLQESFAPLVREQIPDRLLQATLAGRSSGTAAWRNRWREFFTWNVIGPAAATLAAGLLVAIAVERVSPEQGPFVRSSENGRILAQGELARALDSQLASSAQTGPVRIGLSFRSKQGQDCRTFEWISAAVSTSGVACHAGADWHVAALATAARQANDQVTYQMVGAEMPQAIRSTVSTMISGQPFDAADERAARSHRWAGGASR